MDKLKFVRNAKGNSVTQKRIDKILVGSLKDGEQPHFIFPMPGGVQIDGSKPDVSLSGLTSDSKIVITDQRVLLLKQSKSGEKKDQIPISNIEDFNGKAGGLLSIGNIEITTKEHTYSGALHQNIESSEISMAENFISEWEHEPSDLIEGSAGSEDTGSVRAHRVLEQVRVTETYGVGVREGKYKLEFDTEGLHFGGSGASNKTQSINIDRIEFQNISTTSERDFKKENRSRYINQLNPFLDDASPAKKQNKELVKIPVDGGAKYVKLIPGRRTSFGEILDGLSGIDPRLGPNNSEKSQEENKESSENESALEILKKRLAKGDISPEEFEERKQYLDDTEA